MRIAITGGRDHEPPPAELIAFLRLWRRLGGTTLIHGDARGVDRIIGARAEARGIEVVKKPVDHALDGPWPAAGHRRNRRMLMTQRAQALVAFSGGRGTASCVSTGQELGIEVWRWDAAAGDFLKISKGTA